MNESIGIVKEIFIPEELSNSSFLSILNSNKIGFRILLNDEIITIIEEQNEYNCGILKNDKVVVEKLIADEKYSIIRLHGDDYE